MTLRGQIHDLLEQHGPMTAAQIRGLKKVPHLPSMLSQMAKHGQLKRKGKYRKAVYALPNQNFGSNGTALPAIPGARGVQAAGIQTAPDFVAAITADGRMVLVSENAPACMFTPEQTRQINALLIEHMS